MLLWSVWIQIVASQETYDMDWDGGNARAGIVRLTSTFYGTVMSQPVTRCHETVQTKPVLVIPTLQRHCTQHGDSAIILQRLVLAAIYPDN